MATTMTREQWEAEKARIDEERKRLLDIIILRTDARSYDAKRVIEDYLPYPPKPEKTVTIAPIDWTTIRTYRRRDDLIEYTEAPGAAPVAWQRWMYTEQLRALASLLPENEEQ